MAIDITANIASNVLDAIPDDAPEPEVLEDEAPQENEALEEPNEDEPGEEESVDETEGDDEAEEEAPDAATAKLKAGKELADDHKFLVDGKEVTGKELKAGFLRQADYTKKTQELATQRKELVTELEAVKEDNTEIVEWARSLQDPETMEFELKSNFPDTWDQIRDKIIADAIEEQEMTPNELAWKRKAERAEVAQKKREQEEARNQTKEEARAHAQKTNELRQTFDGWATETLTAVGLDPKSADHQELVREQIKTKFAGQTWTKDHFAKAAARVAEMLKVKPKGEPKPKVNLPPVRTSGHKSTGSDKKAAKKSPMDVGEGIARIRQKYGLA